MSTCCWLTLFHFTRGIRREARGQTHTQTYILHIHNQLSPLPRCDDLRPTPWNHLISLSLSLYIYLAICISNALLSLYLPLSLPRTRDARHLIRPPAYPSIHLCTASHHITSPWIETTAAALPGQTQRHRERRLPGATLRYATETATPRLLSHLNPSPSPPYRVLRLSPSSPLPLGCSLSPLIASPARRRRSTKQVSQSHYYHRPAPLQQGTQHATA